MYKISIKTLLCTVLCLLSVTTFAQKKLRDKKSSKPALSSQNIPLPEVVDFETAKNGDQGTAKQSAGNSSAATAPSLTLDYKNAILVTPLNYFWGFIDIGLERAITDQFSVEVSAGVAFKGAGWEIVDAFSLGSNANVKALGDTYNSKGITLEEVVTPNYYRGDAYNSNGLPIRAATIETDSPISLTFSFTPRYYLKGEVFDGFYLGVRTQYVEFNYLTPTYSFPTTGGYEGSTLSTKTKRTLLNILPSMGYHSHLRSNERIRLGLEIGVGPRFSSFAGSAVINTRSTNQYSSEPYQQDFTQLGIMSLGRIGYSF